MATKSEKYSRIVQNPYHWFEVALTVGTSGLLVTKGGEAITFGGDRLLIDNGGPENGFREEAIVSMSTHQDVFPSDVPQVGGAVSAEIDVEMLAPYNVPKRARIVPYFRALDLEETSEWLQQGVYYIDTRSQTKNAEGADVAIYHGFDAMILTDKDYPSDKAHTYPLLDKTMVQFIASNMKNESTGQGITVEASTLTKMNKNYKFNLPTGYSMREVLQLIAASYGGNFVISPEGQLRLVLLNDLPLETRILVTEDGFGITFGTGSNLTRISV